MKRVKVYELYPSANGFTNSTIGYRGHITAIAAVSIKQAYYFGHNEVWADNDARPIGIIWKYERGRPNGDRQVASGAWTYTQGEEPRHGVGVKAVARFLGRVG